METKLENSRKKDGKPAKRRTRERRAHPVLRGFSIPISTVVLTLIIGLLIIPGILRMSAPAIVMDVAPAEAFVESTPVPESDAQQSEPVTAEAAFAAADDGAEETCPLAYQFGDEAAEIADIQERLMALSYMDSDEPTEYFGPATEEAVKRFQRVHYMAETGIADEQTMSVLFSDSAMVYVIEKGDSGEDVATIQTRLNELGYYEGKENGFFGTATYRALVAFETKNKIESDGVADQETRDLLYSSNAKPKVDPTPTPKPTPTPTKKPTSTPKPASTAGSTGSTGSTSIDVVASASADGLISVAKAQLGDPYVWSQEGPDSFDCSGLVYFSLRSVGVSVGRLNAAGFAEVVSWTTIGSVGELKPGDLIFFKSDSSDRISHTGIWLGGNQYIHASSTAGKVVISSWSNWASRNFTHGKRVF